jgi:hypothetical protein
MAGRSLTADVLKYLRDVDRTLGSVDVTDHLKVQDTLEAFWRLYGFLEATTLRRASRQQQDMYHEEVLLPRAKRTAYYEAEQIPHPRTDKDGIPW